MNIKTSSKKKLGVRMWRWELWNNKVLVSTSGYIYLTESSAEWWGKNLNNVQ